MFYCFQSMISRKCSKRECPIRRSPLYLLFNNANLAAARHGHRLFSFKLITRLCPSTAGRDSGYSLPMVMIIALLMILGGVVAANRTNSSLFGEIFQGQAFEARAAAEIGMTRIISELNKERNRWLMVKREGDNEQLWTRPMPGDTVDKLRMNPCASETTAEYSKLDPSNGNSTNYGSWYINQDGSVSSSPSSASRAYRLVSVTRQEFYRNERHALNPFLDRNLDVNASGTGEIIIAVEGRKLNKDGVTIAKATLEKTFELVPKCCKVSFGGKHGQLDYSLDSSGATLCFKPSASTIGYGLLAGAADNNTGFYQIAGRPTFSWEQSDGSLAPVNPIYCVSSTSELQGCNLSGVAGASGITIKNIDADLPPVKSFPTPPAAPTPGQLNATGPISTSISSTHQFKSIIKTDFLHNFKIGAKTFAVINGGYTTGSLPSFCRADAEAIHCNLSRFSYNSNANVIFVTGAKKIRFYFPNSGSVVTAVGSPTLMHCLTINYSSGDCSTTPATQQLTNLSLYGCVESEACRLSQSVALAGGASALKLFAYFPIGDIQLVGNTKFEGVLWVNILQAAGNPSFVIPGSGVGSVLEEMGMLPSDSLGGTTNPLFAYDFVARATLRYRWI